MLFVLTFKWKIKLGMYAAGVTARNSMPFFLIYFEFSRNFINAKETGVGMVFFLFVLRIL